MSLLSLLLTSALVGRAFSNPLDLGKKLAHKQQFSLEQVAVPRKQAWFAPDAHRRTYMKYGLPIPYHIEDALAAFANGTQSTVPVRPVKGDVEYLINVTVGNHVLALDMDTGSSDL